jgi:hypothetical protein
MPTYLKAGKPARYLLAVAVVQNLDKDAKNISSAFCSHR